MLPKDNPRSHRALEDGEEEDGVFEVLKPPSAF